MRSSWHGPEICSALIAILSLGCDGVVARSGSEALLRVGNAQYFAGAMPEESGGLLVTAVETVNNSIRPGQQNKRITGRLGIGASAVALGLADDTGYWVVPGGSPDLINLDEPSYQAQVSFSPRLMPGPHNLILRAVDKNHQLGPPSVLSLNALSAVPNAPLVVSLFWDRDADLDLHVVLPDGIEVWSGNVSSYQPATGQPTDPMEAARGTYLDFDSNNQCLRDGRRLENVIWRQPPSSGVHLVRVDTFSLCGEPAATWRIEVRQAGMLIASAGGDSGESDTRLPHEQGAGVLALPFTIP